MKNAIICSMLFAALVAQPAAAHTIIREMLRDTATNHDLEKIRTSFLKNQPHIDDENRIRASEKALTYRGREAKPATSP
jgi:hypothetical protein